MPVEQGQEATRSPTDYGPTFKAQTGQGSKAVSRQGSAMSRPFPAPSKELLLGVPLGRGPFRCYDQGVSQRFCPAG